MKSKVALTVFLGLVVACLLFLNLRAILRPAKYEAVYQERCELNTNRLTSILLLQELYHQDVFQLHQHSNRQMSYDLRM